jgi:hypothetical protein
MPSIAYAGVITTSHFQQIMTSDRLWEHRCLMLTDDISPDLLPETLRESVRQLLAESSHRGVALNWSTFRVHLNETSHPAEAYLVVRVDVL